MTLPSPSHDFSEAGPAELLKALRLPDSPESEWSESDLRDMLQHVLEAPLVSQVAQILGEAFQRTLEDMQSQCSPGVVCLRHVLHHPSPPRALLVVIKDFAKVSASHPTRPLPEELTKILYLLALVVARRHGHDITTLEPAQFNSALQWAIGCPWLDIQVRQLFESVDHPNPSR